MNKLINQLEQMKENMLQASEQWEALSDDEQNQLAEKYPFDKSFDEVVADLDEWIKHLKK
ncbi:MAG: hypothetical protein ACK4M9_11960 [Anaerobacillus sp.]|uniref:hypothetical protein n=1 Tax=Anaerobacillus sp. TaxID=1872506 RepID=UPI00391A5AC8